MTTRKKVLAISGSTRQDSTNHALINAIADLYQDVIDVKNFQKLTEIPHFNPDLDTDTPPQGVSDLRRQLKDADGILICTPEYAMGVPGTLKNAIDWTVSSMEFSHKPVALITASLSGHKAHLSLIETLKVIECDIPEASRLVISYVKTKVKDNKIIDEKTLEQVNYLMNSFVSNMNEKTRNA